MLFTNLWTSGTLSVGVDEYVLAPNNSLTECDLNSSISTFDQLSLWIIQDFWMYQRPKEKKLATNYFCSIIVELQCNMPAKLAPSPSPYFILIWYLVFWLLSNYLPIVAYNHPLQKYWMLMKFHTQYLCSFMQPLYNFFIFIAFPY